VYDVFTTQPVASGSVSGVDTFIAAAGVVATVVLGYGGIWAVFRAAHPRRRLTYTVSHAPLVDGPGSGNLDFSHNGILLTDPQVVTVTLANTGRRDIGSRDFDRDEPFRIRLDVPYARLLNTTSKPDDAEAPPAWLYGAELNIGPGRLGCGTTVVYRVLVDRVPTPHCRHSLLDVRVQCAPAASPNGTPASAPLVRP
jgi:hypothetical protein